MTIPVHVLHVYDKPALSNNFLKRYRTYNYTHKIRAVGGFDTASCELALSGKEAELFLEQYVGNRVAIYVDNPAEPIWEGLITRISFQEGTVTFTNSLDSFYNRIGMIYQNPNAAPPQVTTTAYIDALASQAIYGIKETLLNLNVDANASNVRRDAIRALKLATHGWPITSSVFNSEGRQGLVRVEMQGFYKTLDWDHYATGGGAVLAANTIVTNVMQANINGTTFFDDTDTSGISANASFSIVSVSQTGMSRWQYLQTIQEAGDGVHRWILGISPTDPNTGTRRFYYRQADENVASAIKYTVRQKDGLGIIRNVYGQRVDPWRVTPDGRIRLNDALVGWDLQGDDPRISYLSSISYNAERQSVSWQSEDDTTLDGIFNLSAYYNPMEATTGSSIGSSKPLNFYG